jgi:hypothetical protein
MAFLIPIPGYSARMKKSWEYDSALTIPGMISKRLHKKIQRQLHNLARIPVFQDSSPFRKWVNLVASRLLANSRKKIAAAISRIPLHAVMINVVIPEGIAGSRYTEKKDGKSRINNNMHIAADTKTGWLQYPASCSLAIRLQLILSIMATPWTYC